MNGHKNDSQQPKSRPISNNTSLDDLFPSRFLKPEQLLAWRMTEITVTVAKIQEEEVEPKPGQKEWKPVIYFQTKVGKVHPQGYLLSAKVDKDSLKTATGAATIGEVIGKQITIKIADYRGRAVLRIDSKPPAQELG
jgi:hypothetical protein